MPLFTRIRFQLLGAYIVAVLLPVVLRYSQNWQVISTPSVQNTLIGVLLAITAGFFAWRRLDLFPTVDGSAYVFWSFLPAFIFVMAAFLLFRLEYSRYLFLASLIICLVWFFAIHFTLKRYFKPSFSIVLGGKADELLKISHANWISLESPDPFAALRMILDNQNDPNTKELWAQMRQEKRRDWSQLFNPVPGYHGIVVDLRHNHGPLWEEFFATATLSGTPVYHHKQIEEVLTGKVLIEHLSENNFGSLLPDLTFLKLKQFIDFFVAVLCLPILLPILGLISILIYLQDGRPIFFLQERTGYRGKIFRPCKFRTMVVCDNAIVLDPTSRDDCVNRLTADKKSQGLEEASAVELAMTLENDERITPLGRFLRKSRIDELPQVFNILKGEMSWIGPRPEAIALTKLYALKLPFYSYRHAVRPGISGWAQVNQGHVTSVDDVHEKLKYDFYYIKHISPWLDFLILLKTLKTMVSGFGAK